MATFIDNVFDKLGNIILTKTVTKAVWGLSSGNRLDQELDGIEAALAQPNTGTNADRAYSAGKYIYHVKNKELYKAKSNIASGAAFNKASGGNVDVVNIGDQLQTISSDLTSLPISRFSLNSSNPFRFYISSYGTALILAFVSGIGAVGILTTKQGNSVSSKSLADGNTWSFAQFDIHIYSGDNKYIEITSNSASYSTGTVITGF